MNSNKSKLSDVSSTAIDQEDLQEDQENDEVIGRAFRNSLLVIVALVIVGLGAYLISIFRVETKQEVKTELETPTLRETIAVSEQPEIPFVDATVSSGLQFLHVNGKAGERLLPETMGGGSGFLDFDNDGDQDVLFVNSSPWPWTQADTSKPTMKLFQNDGTGKYADVTSDLALNATFYGMGPSFGDFDGDGWTDIFITAVGKNRLFRNMEGKRFEEVAEKFGVAGREDQWSCPSLWFDFDRDGHLDLLVGEYVRWSRDQDLQQSFTLSGIGRAYGQPTGFSGTHLSLYHNLGDRFEEIGKQAGLHVNDPNTGVPVAKSLGLAILDADNDGWMDIVVANDTVPNFLFLNLHNGTFSETGYAAGIAVDRNGTSTGAMGIDVGNFRNDERQAIVIGNFANEPSSLYVSRGKRPQFSDESALTGFGPQTRLRLTFGLFFSDMDLDGRLDMVCANGHLEDEIAKFQPSQRYEQSPQLFWNAGRGAPTEFVELDETKLGKDFHRAIVGRSASYADIDSDGDIDVLFVGNGQNAVLYRNDQHLGHNWLRVKVKAKGSNTEAIGATVTIKTGGESQRRLISPTRSYLSQCELVATFGFGDQKPTEMMIQWPDGTHEHVDIPTLNTTMQIQQESVKH